ncbi:rab9 effector protein with kelch motifs [Syngnathus scovelli]|uniref:rab9 effector protein with kelch motifs n=1 Tax=Syngnathus scovelli TaxID=161590 RepID=UPI0035CC72DB
MALASGHWLDKEMTGEAPCPRYGHASALAGNIVFIFGGASNYNQEDNPVYFDDFYMLTVSPDDVIWEQIPQSGEVPTAREGHTLCVVKGKVYVFGGVSNPKAAECLPGVFSFDIVSLTWDCLTVGGVTLRTRGHSSVAVKDNIYVYGGTLGGIATDDLMVFNTVSYTWTPVKTSGSPPPAMFGQGCALVGDQVFMFGGYGDSGEFCKDIHVLNIENLVWQKWESKGELPAACSGYTLTAHHDKDIYLFGGKSSNDDQSVTSSNEIHKFSIAKMKWKVPFYVGIPPARRNGHTAFIVHSHLYIFGGKNEEQEFNDLKVMKLINPSERQPVMKEILSEFGLQGLSYSFTPTKIPNVRYDLSDSSPANQSKSITARGQIFVHRDFSAVRDEAMSMIQTAFTLLDQEFQKLDQQKRMLSKSAAALQIAREGHEAQKQQHQQELQEMLDRHRSQNEAWLRARAEENDRERRELCRLREEVLQEQEKLKEEHSSIQKRSEHLLSIMQQFKGM